MRYVYNDGGRSKYYKGDAGDCAVRAIAIATEMDYKEVYDLMKSELDDLKETRYGKRRSKLQAKSSCRNGTPKRVCASTMARLGWTWVPTMFFGEGCTTHLRSNELPMGRLVVSVSKHLCAVIDGVLHDTHDCSRDGGRCVYGYWTKTSALTIGQFKEKFGG